MKLSELKAPEGSNKKKRRVGRGTGSGRGKTCGRGHKGQKSRSGSKARIGFEGGQMPLIRRLPKRGFTNKFKNIYQIVNIEKLNLFKENEIITPEILKDARVISNVKSKIKILGKGEIKKSLTIHAHKFSKSAKDKITKVNGNIKIIK